MALSAFVIRILLLAVPGILASKLYKKLRGRPEREAWETFIEILVFSLAAYATVHVFGCDRSDSAVAPLTIHATPPFTLQSPQPVPFPGPPAYSIPATQPTMIQPRPGQVGQPVAIQVVSALTIASTQPVTVDGTTTAILPNQTVTIQPAVTGLPSTSVFEAFLNEQVSIGGYVKTISLATAIALMFSLAGSYLHNYGVVNWIGRKIRASRRSGDEDAWTYFNNSDDVEWVFVRDHANNRVYFGSIKRFSDSEKPKEMVLEDVQVYSQDKDELLYCTRAVFLSRDHDDWTIEVPDAAANNAAVATPAVAPAVISPEVVAHG